MKCFKCGDVIQGQPAVTIFSQTDIKHFCHACEFVMQLEAQYYSNNPEEQPEKA